MDGGASDASAPAKDHDTTSAVAAEADWCGLALIEITNFPALRRAIGTEASGELATRLASAISVEVAGVQAFAAGRALIECALRGGTRTDVVAATGEIEAWLDRYETPQPLRIKLGGVVYPAGHGNPVWIAEQAEAALNAARQSANPVLHDLSDKLPGQDAASLMHELAGALDRGELFLHYQPKVNVRQQRVASVEALIRWQHPTRGLILPGDFIPAAEDAREVTRLTLWTLERVIADQRVMAMAGDDVPVFVNISGQLLADQHFVASACAMVRDGGAKIGFEITETSVIRDPQSAIANLNAFADVGIVIAIDDYGAGLSSLAYLKQLPARELKIDKMFVMQLSSSHRDPLIVRSTIDLAHALEMEVVAEGVETQAALALLTVMGCDMVQGYLISRPVELAELLTFLHDYRAQTAAGAEHPAFRRPVGLLPAVGKRKA